MKAPSTITLLVCASAASATILPRETKHEGDVKKVCTNKGLSGDEYDMCLKAGENCLNLAVPYTKNREYYEANPEFYERCYENNMKKLRGEESPGFGLVFCQTLRGSYMAPEDLKTMDEDTACQAVYRVLESISEGHKPNDEDGSWHDSQRQIPRFTDDFCEHERRTNKKIAALQNMGRNATNVDVSRLVPVIESKYLGEDCSIMLQDQVSSANHDIPA